MSNKDNLQRERTLLMSCLFSAWAPVVTGYAAFLGGSILLVGDFFRRTSELLGLIFAWRVARLINRNKLITNEQIDAMEKRSSIIVSIVLFISSIVVGITAYHRLMNLQPTGNISLGLFVSAAGFLVNGAFFFRYANLNKKSPGPILTSQAHLYRAKTITDFAIVLSLILSRVLPPALGIYADPIGSIGLTILLFGTAWQNLFSSVLKK